MEWNAGWIASGATQLQCKFQRTLNRNQDHGTGGDKGTQRVELVARP